MEKNFKNKKITIFLFSFLFINYSFAEIDNTSNFNFFSEELYENEETYDPLQSFNEFSFNFNIGLDRVIVRPLANSYKKIVPKTIRGGIDNVFNNLNSLPSAFNKILQGRPKDSLLSLGSFIINTTVGIFGIFNVSSSFGVSNKKEDFGQTLGVWGMKEGAYIVLPFLGVTTVRDIFGVVIDNNKKINVASNFTKKDQLLMKGLDTIRKRLKLASINNIIEDENGYILVRESYIQKRKNDILDR